jgi:hypothetical protein
MDDKGLKYGLDLVQVTSGGIRFTTLLGVKEMQK